MDYLFQSANYTLLFSNLERITFSRLPRLPLPVPSNWVVITRPIRQKEGARKSAKNSHIWGIYMDEGLEQALREVVENHQAEVTAEKSARDNARKLFLRWSKAGEDERLEERMQDAIPSRGIDIQYPTRAASDELRITFSMFYDAFNTENRIRDVQFSFVWRAVTYHHIFVEMDGNRRSLGLAQILNTMSLANAGVGQINEALKYYRSKHFAPPFEDAGTDQVS